MDNTVADMMVEGQEAGDDLSSQGCLLPYGGLVNEYNLFLNVFGKSVTDF
jgi:hypothetical protein